MANATAERPGLAMGKKKSAEANVRIEADVAKMGRMVASFEDRSMSEVLSEILRPALKRRYEDHLKRAQAEIAKDDPQPRPPKR